MATARSAGAYRFGKFEFDPASRELKKGGTRLRVPDQSLAILALLLQRPGELVTRDEIRERLWPNGTIVEFEHSVNSAVQRLRDVLSDSAAKPRYVRTVAKRGYQFIAAVEAPAPDLPHYRIVEEIGRGAMGIVYRAEDLRLGREVALKMLPPELASDPQRKERLIREARAASALNHPNIVTVHDIGSDRGRDFIVMEYVAGKPLSEMIPPQGMAPERAIRIAVQIADALARAHEAGILHRDVKPGNIRVNQEGRVKLLDFGLAKFKDPAENPPAREQTVEGAVVGTVGYMSPEQAEGKPVDERSDIFTFGAVLYEMVTGRRAFERDSNVATLAAIVNDEPTPVSQLAPAIPDQLDALVMRCLRKREGERFQNIGEVKTALDRLQQRVEPGANVASEPARGRRRYPPAAIGLAAVIVAVAAWFWAVRPESIPLDLAPVPLTSYPGWQGWPSFSPDGNKVAFTWRGDREDNDDIYIARIGSADRPVRLTSDPARDLFPAWSPDDRYIAFLRRTRARITLCRIPSLGGPERNVADFAFGTTGDGVAWTPDSQWLALALRDSSDGPFSIWLISLSSGERRRLTRPSAGSLSSDQFPSFSPDGRTLAFSREIRSFVSSLYAVELSPDLTPKGEPRQITSERYGAVAGTAWTTDGREIVYSAGDNANSKLYRVPVSGGTPVLMPYASEPWWPAISRTRPRLAYVTRRFNTNLWRIDIRTGERNMLLRSNRLDDIPDYSPNGRKIVFQSNRSGAAGLWTCDADGSECMELTSFGNAVGGSARWSPDSRLIAFDWRVDGQSDIYVIQADGGGLRRMTSNGADDIVPSWSRNGQWIYFSSNRSGRTETWKVPVMGGGPVQVTHAGGGPAFESTDGEYLYYVKLGSQGNSTRLYPLFRMSARGGAAIQIVPGVMTWPYVTAKAVYFSTDRGAVQRLEFGSNKVSMVIPTPGMYTSFCVSPDDSFLLYGQLERSSIAEVMLVEGFR